MTVLTGFVLSSATPNKESQSDYKLVKTIVDVLGEVDSHYVRDLDDDGKKRLVEDMINGGLEKLDRYSAYMNADEFKQFETQTEGNFSGVGIQLGVDPKSGVLMVISPMVGTPAYDAGILAGDIIVKINDKSTENMRISEAVKIITGEVGTQVKLTVIHEGARETETIPIVRAKIEVKSVVGYKHNDENDPAKWEWFVADGIAYIRLRAIHRPLDGRYAQGGGSRRASSAKALILDLRGTIREAC